MNGAAVGKADGWCLDAAQRLALTGDLDARCLYGTLDGSGHKDFFSGQPALDMATDKHSYPAAENVSFDPTGHLQVAALDAAKHRGLSVDEGSFQDSSQWRCASRQYLLVATRERLEEVQCVQS